ncbi:hypothetical protein FJY93_04510 [Candidatus Kaiserbacteria bacterium]|nr:hypothetical protein [Candidatus Kaiserbacteria bacterium]
MRGRALTEARIYPEIFSLQIRDGAFYMAFRSGKHTDVFASNLVFAKRLGRMILRHIDELDLISCRNNEGRWNSTGLFSFTFLFEEKNRPSKKTNTTPPDFRKRGKRDSPNHIESVAQC